MVRKLILLVLLSLLPAMSWAADTAGIPVTTTCSVPVNVNGKATVGRALVVEATTPEKPLRVFFVASDGTVGEIMYGLIRREGPQPSPEPGPDPQPDPQPDPVPPPVPTSLWAIVVAESSTRTPQQAIVLASPVVRKLFQDEHLRIVDPKDDAGQPTPVNDDVKAYVQRAVGKTTPVLFLVSPDGTVYYEGDLPDSVAAMTALVAKYKAKEGNP